MRTALQRSVSSTCCAWLFSFSELLSSDLATRRRNDVVHPQVLHHLTVMIGRVSYSIDEHQKARSVALGWDRIVHVVFIQCQRCSVKTDERAFEIVHHLSLRLHSAGRCFVVGASRRPFAQRGSGELVVGSRQVFDLLCECTNTRKLTIGRGKSVFLLRHDFRGRYE